MSVVVVGVNFFSFSTSSLKPLHRFASKFRVDVPRKLCNMYIYNVLRYKMSLCNIPSLTSSLEPLHRFASNFVWMFLGWTTTKFVKIGVLPLFFMELWAILCNFWPILKKSIKPLTRNPSYFDTRGSSF